MRLLLFLFFLPNFTFAQSKFDLSRYTHVWVVDKNPNPNSWVSDEIHSIQKGSTFSTYSQTDLTVLIPDSNDIIIREQSLFILAFLINNSPDTILIDRCDATIYPVETQILVDCEWKTFQLSMGSSCGNSYFKAQLPPKSYYILHIVRPAKGEIQTQFRLKMELGGKLYFSNSCSIMLRSADIKKAGQPLKPLSF